MDVSTDRPVDGERPAPDGKRVAVLTAAEETEVRKDTVVVITNFFDELRRIAPSAQR